MKLSNQNISKALEKMNKIDAKIIEASKFNTIIKNLSFEEFYKNFQSNLLKLSYLIGLDKPLEKIEIALLANHVYDYHDNFTIDEIELAFKLNEAGKLEKKINHFQIFTCSYISDILNNYQLTKSKAIFEFEKLKEIETTKENNMEHKRMTNEEAYDLIVEMYLRDKELPQFGPYQMAFDYLKENNLILVDWDVYKKNNQINIKRIFDLSKEELNLQYRQLYVKDYIVSNNEI